MTSYDEDAGEDWDDYYDPDPPEPIANDPEFPSGAYVRVAGYGGVAWYVRHVLEDRVVCRMVGDDRDFSLDRDELESLAREEFCGECGQIGCEHDGYDREEG